MVFASEDSAFVDLAEDAYPIIIEYFVQGTDELVETDVIEGPGAYRVKGIDERGFRVDVHISYANGMKFDGDGDRIHCCKFMTAQMAKVCPNHDDPWDCPDYVIVERKGGFGIPIRDGGRSYMRLYYCPWCATQLVSDEELAEE